MQQLHRSITILKTREHKTAPVSLILRIDMLSTSATYMFPLSSTVSPLGWFIRASLNLPSTCPVYPSADPITSLGLLSIISQQSLFAHTQPTPITKNYKIEEAFHWDVLVYKFCKIYLLINLRLHVKGRVGL